MRHCAFLTLSDPTGYVMDDDLAHAPLEALGFKVESIPWNRPGIDWSRFDCVVIRSTWDYQDHVVEFLAVLESIEASGTQLHNSRALVEWNLRKTYLRELEAAGVPVVPTMFLERMQPGSLEGICDRIGSPEIVVKPVISATAHGAYRVNCDAAAAMAGEIEAFFANRALMAQPFIRSVLGEGEYSLFYFNGEFSHAVRKRPKPADFRVQEEHGGLIDALAPDGELLQAGGAVMRALGEAPLYARVDLIRPDAAATYLLMELELIEPSLYLRMDPAAPARLARAIERRMSA